MAKIRVKIDEFDKAWDKATDEMRRTMHKGLVSGTLKGQKIVMENSPVDTGLYQASWRVIEMAFGHVQLGNTAPHAPAIEFGARPHTPPIGPLLAWAKRVLQDPSAPPGYSDAVWSLAKGTQNKIAQFGQEPKHVLTNAIPKIRDEIIREIKRHL